jgi:hypothetical protein
MPRPQLPAESSTSGGWDSYFYAIDAATGKESGASKPVLTRTLNQEGIQSSAAVADGNLYALQ